MEDILFSVHYFIIFILLGIVGFTITGRMMKHKFLAYAISKPVGLALFAYPVWLLTSSKLLNFQNELLLQILFLVVVIACAFIIFSDYKKYFYSIKDFAIKAVALEIISLVLVGLYLYIRSFNPNLEGTEKFMDLGMLMSAGKTDFFPFFDFWSPNQAVNYYYYGFYLFAIPVKLTGIPYAVGYNLALGFIAIQCLLLSAVVVFRLVRSIPAAIFGAALVTLSGNFHYASCALSNLNELATKCYYPSATRIYSTSYTINEMPSYSFILGDLHPHVMVIPFFLITLLLIIEIYKSKKINYLLHGAFIFIIATAALINLWDFLTLGAIYAIVVILKIAKHLRKVSKLKDTEAELKNKNLVKTLKLFVLSFLAAISPFILFFFFFLNFKSPVTGIGFAPDYIKYAEQIGRITSNAQYPSGFNFLFGIWGAFIIPAVVAILIVLAIKFFKVQLRKPASLKSLRFPVILLVAYIGLIAFTELFFFQDLFHIANPYYFRANTVFKLTYHAWILAAITSAVLIGIAWKWLLNVKSQTLGITADIALIIFVSVIFTLQFLYPVIAVDQAYKPKWPWGMSENDKKLTLDGSKHIQYKEYDDYQVIQWLNKNQKSRVVILEAVGGAYTYYGRIGVNTGMGNLVNWETHEWTWRFHYPSDDSTWKTVLATGGDTGYNDASSRTKEVKEVYESESVEDSIKILRKYNVKYIVVGGLEDRTYSQLKLNKFPQLGTVVFESGETKLYKVNE